MKFLPKAIAGDESGFMVMTQKRYSCPSAVDDHLHVPKSKAGLDKI